MNSLPISVHRHINSFMVPRVLKDHVPFYHYRDFKRLTYDFFHGRHWFLVCCKGLCENPSHWEHEVVNRSFSRYSDEIIETHYYKKKMDIADSSRGCIYCGFDQAADSEIEMGYDDRWEEDWAEYHAYGDWYDNNEDDLVG